MANRMLGEVAAQMGGRSYTLRLDFNALCELEDLTGEMATAVLTRIEEDKASSKDLRNLALAVMLHHHPDATSRDAGQLLSEAPGVLVQLMIAAYPTQEEVKDLPGNRKAARKPKVSTI